MAQLYIVCKLEQKAASITKSTLDANSTILVMSSSFHIEFHELYRSVFICNCFITTDPDLNVISCGGR